MNLSLIIAIIIIGFAAGLRSLTSPAVVAWAAHFGRLSLGASSLSFISSPITAGILTLLALGEYVADQLPNTPNRTSPPGLIARFVTGTFSAVCILAATNNSIAYGLIGGVAAIGGAFAGYQLRTRLVEKLRIKDIFVAIPEDLVAIGLALAAVHLV